MDETTTRSSGGTAIAAVPTNRSCTRCDSEQELVGEGGGMGKYRCAGCGLTIGFDFDADPVEFLLSRGRPGLYTKDVFGSALLGSERRLS